MQEQPAFRNPISRLSGTTENAPPSLQLRDHTGRHLTIKPNMMMWRQKYQLVWFNESLGAIADAYPRGVGQTELMPRAKAHCLQSRHGLP